MCLHLGLGVDNSVVYVYRQKETSEVVFDGDNSGLQCPVVQLTTPILISLHNFHPSVKLLALRYVGISLCDVACMWGLKGGLSQESVDEETRIVC